MVPGYLEKRRAEVAVYRKALAESNFETIRMLAHRTKGTGTGYGFPALTEFGATLEKAAEACDSELIRNTTDKLAGYLASVKLEFIQ